MVRVERNVNFIRDTNQARTCSRLLRNQKTRWTGLGQLSIPQLRIISL